MKKLIYLLICSVLFTACSKDEKTVTPGTNNSTTTGALEKALVENQWILSFFGEGVVQGDDFGLTKNTSPNVPIVFTADHKVCIGSTEGTWTLEGNSVRISTHVFSSPANANWEVDDGPYKSGSGFIGFKTMTADSAYVFDIELASLQQ